ncbi:protein kinase domain-containing protein [Ditylenchus destructor]|uniref:Protein kinase domain-containing protein n=1 Tax=Ditylenchus destructor TaxID=166010 RepID=A0AAD4N2V4_9BILA|nr:protein kinase domain-containing protein [Ditylenchus destructor]
MERRIAINTFLLLLFVLVRAQFDDEPLEKREDGRLKEITIKGVVYTKVVRTGMGAYSTVYHAYDKSKNRDVAIKMSHKRHCEDGELYIGVLKELYVIQYLNREPNNFVPRFYDGAVSKSMVCIVLESGLLTLKNYIDYFVTDPDTVAHLWNSSLRVAQHLHNEGLQYGDFREDNLMVFQWQDSLILKAIDFNENTHPLNEETRKRIMNYATDYKLEDAEQTEMEDGLRVSLRGIESDIVDLGELLEKMIKHFRNGNNDSLLKQYGATKLAKTYNDCRNIYKNEMAEKKCPPLRIPNLLFDDAYKLAPKETFDDSKLPSNIVEKPLKT